MKRRRQAESKHSRKDLVEALVRLTPALSINNALDYTGLLSLRGDSIAAFDGEVGISFPFESGVRATIPAKPFIELMKKAKANDVTLNVSGGELQIRCGKLEAAITTSEITIPLPSTSEDGWEEIPAGYLNALEFASFCAADDISKGILSCVRAIGNEVTGCDTYRLMLARMEGSFPEGVQFFVPAAQAKTISSHKPTHFKVSEGIVHLINDGDGILSLMTMNGIYPDVSSVLVVEGEEIPLPASELLRILSSVEVLAEDALHAKGKKVMVEIETGKITCSSLSRHGRAKEEIEADCKVQTPITFFVNSTFLEDILPITSSMVHNDRMLKFEGGNFCYVACKITEAATSTEAATPPPQPRPTYANHDLDDDIPF